MRRAGAVAALGALTVVFPALPRGATVDVPTVSATLRITGAAQVVFDWKRDACVPSDIPDTPARAFRDPRGRVHLLITHEEARASSGPSLGRVRHDCTIVFSSQRSPDPSVFADREWLAAPYALGNGRTIVALVHDEYQGNRHPGRCPSKSYTRCWFNAITLAVSRDGGRTFHHAARPPHQLVAALPDRYRPDAGTVGLFEPSNIVRNPDDGFFYAVVQERGPDGTPSGTCVMRTNRLLDPSSWRAWDGTAFQLPFGNPYLGGGAVCPVVAKNEIADMNESLTYNTALHAFLLVGAASSADASGAVVPGIYYSLSSNLVDWTPRRLVLRAQLPWTVRCDGVKPIAYPSALDAASPSRSFETTGRSFFIYYTRFNVGCPLGADRDLLRIPVALN